MYNVCICTSLEQWLHHLKTELIQGVHLNITCSEAQRSDGSPLLMELHDRLIILEVVYQNTPILQTNSYHIDCRGLGQYLNLRPPTLECVNQFVCSHVPQLKLTLLAPEENLIEVGARMDSTRDGKGPLVEVDFTIKN